MLFMYKYDLKKKEESVIGVVVGWKGQDDKTGQVKIVYIFDNVYQYTAYLLLLY